MIDYLTALLQEDEDEDELLPAPALPLQKSDNPTESTEPTEPTELPHATEGDWLAETNPLPTEPVSRLSPQKAGPAVTKPAGKSAVQPAEKPAEKLAEKPAAKSAAKPAAKAAAKPAKPAVKSSQKPKKPFPGATDTQTAAGIQRPQGGGKAVPTAGTAELLQRAAAKKRAAGAVTSAAQKPIQEGSSFAESGTASGTELSPESPLVKSRNAAALLARLPIRRERTQGKRHPDQRQDGGGLVQNPSVGGLQSEAIDWDKLTEREARRYDGGFSLF